PTTLFPYTTLFRSFVEQRNGPDREPEPRRRRVDLLDRGALGEQVTDLVRIRGEDAVHPEPRAVLHDDDRLPQPPPEADRCAHDAGRRARRGYDLEQRHP